MEQVVNIENVYHYIFLLVHIYVNRKKNIVHVKHRLVLVPVFFHHGQNGAHVRKNVILEFKNVRDIIYLFNQIVQIIWKKYVIVILNVVNQVRRNEFFFFEDDLV
jgi:hypothetical protein